MTWRILSTVFTHPAHVHFRDAHNLPVHLLAMMTKAEVHLFVGDDDRERCPIYLRVFGTTAGTKVSVVRFTRWTVQERQIVWNVLASLGVDEDERRRAIGWLHAAERGGERDAEGRFIRPNRGGERVPIVAEDPNQWPRNLSDVELAREYDERSGKSRQRRDLIEREIRRRGMSFLPVEKEKRKR